jgi:tripartite-type tricarboxylate transporter receptor subunit TctC
MNASAPAPLTQDELKTQVGQAALQYVVPGEIVGVGTGSTVNKFIEALASMKDRIRGAVSSSVASTERLRALGITSAQRSTQMPEIATFRDQGMDGFDVTGWYGLCTQAKVPGEIITRINTDINRMLGTGQALRKRLEEQGIDIAPATPAEFAAMVKQEIAKWTKVVRETKLEGD